ncbi:hypothetical protein K435DRAFT_873283 [Dendrothele bispora CBS 962.96]|uniref:Uncharacterized protein n=1 Tax=Dendrothele bispora (strain CBS 962.96) TaxID=1314807 RepID=A0A4S8KZR6_DENBC|nr:hypothetical protein K435DRAFT_873283 [Dendrothele bispora CBS 962.96]
MSGLRTTLRSLRDAPTNTSPSSPILQVASANRLIVGAALASLHRSIKFFVDESCSSLTFFCLSSQEVPPEIPKSATPFGISFGSFSPLSTLGADRYYDSSAHSCKSRNAAINDISVGSPRLLASHQLLSVQLRPSWSSTPGLLRRKSINGWGSPQAYPGSWDSPVFEQNVAEGVVPALPGGSLAAPIVSVAKHDQFDSDEEDQSDADMPPLQTPPDSESESGVELVY